MLILSNENVIGAGSGNAFDPLNFNPHNYWDSDNVDVVSTTTTAKDYMLQHDLVNPAAGNQPSLNTEDSNFNGKDSLSFDVSGDYLTKSISGYRASDADGEIHTVVRTTSANISFGFSVTEIATNNNTISVGGATTTRYTFIRDTVNTAISDSLSTDLSLQGTMLLSLVSNGSNFRIFLDGVEKTVVMDLGLNDGKWFDSISVDTLTIGALLRLTNVFGTFDWAATGTFPLLSDVDRTTLMDGLKNRYGI